MRVEERTNDPNKDPTVERVHLYLFAKTNWSRDLAKIIFGLMAEVTSWEAKK